MATAAVGETPAETLSLTGRNRTGKRLGKAGMRRRRRGQLGFGDGLLASCHGGVAGIDEVEGIKRPWRKKTYRELSPR
jgi:hypothetical protein